MSTVTSPSPNARRVWAASAATAAAALASVALLGGEVYDHAPGALDLGAERWALAHRTTAALVPFEWITRIGEPAVVFALAVGIAIWLWRTGARRAAAATAVAPLVAIVVFNLVKQLVHRARPEGGLLLRAVTYSFPSGHAAVSAAAFGTLGWVLAREGTLSSTGAMLLAVVCPVLIGLSRIYLGVHWATDVLAGWCLGLAVAALSAGVYERGRRSAR